MLHRNQFSFCGAAAGATQPYKKKTAACNSPLNQTFGKK